MKVVEEAETPRRIILVGLFPELDSSASEDALSLLQAQNDGLRIPDWRILNRVRRSTMAEITIAVDPLSADTLKHRGNVVNYGFGVVKLREKAKPSMPVVDKDAADTEYPNSEEQPCCSKDVVVAPRQLPNDTQVQQKSSEVGTELQVIHKAPPMPPKTATTTCPTLQQVLEEAQKNVGPIASPKPAKRPPLRGSSKAAISSRKGKGDARTAEEAVLLKGNRGKKVAARGRKDRK
ncbi:PREDICTED: uncharacterized protein LOC108375629 [Rhagoletis zephyria]|uniref:uncharacterized protein LOC108375629 n=1 Tax=Rhagoletis zephyria TaxID=28612 RepID=UPI0008118A19|nr:PREDICTED: uncharacterized protein LOC108375629 [Rhagoletis zephyria]